MKTGLKKQEKTTDIWFDEKNPLIHTRTSTKSYPPQTAKGSFPERKDFAIEVKLPPCISPGPMRI